MIASLPMYDRPANAAAHDRLWVLIRDHLRDDGIAAPDELDRETPYRDSWDRPDLVVGQICVMPYRQQYALHLTLIGASDYGLEGCDPGYFRSLIVCHKDDDRDLPALATARFAANAKHSYSGFDALCRHFGDLGLTPPEPQITGNHDASVRAIANGQADFACIDAQTWRMQQQDLPEVKDLRILFPMAQAPGQSFVTRQSDNPAPYFAAIKAAIAGLSNEDAALLSLRDIVALPASAYA